MHAQPSWSVIVGEFLPAVFDNADDAVEAFDISVGLSSADRGVAAGKPVSLLTPGGIRVREYTPTEPTEHP